QALLTSDIKAVLGGSEFFIAPVVVRGRSIGLVYADCRLSNRALKREQFAAFNHFIQQVNLVLSMQ
ncbi:MAG TPA: histidine kinase, partial [Pseudomonadales bacterium]|nr:histidine kinase [Pseudomonadales bacterium]